MERRCCFRFEVLWDRVPIDSRSESLDSLSVDEEVDEEDDDESSSSESSSCRRLMRRLLGPLCVDGLGGALCLEPAASGSLVKDGNLTGCLEPSLLRFGVGTMAIRPCNHL